MKNKYYTRIDNNFNLIDRNEKVFYNNPIDFTKKQINFYNDNGFIILKNYYKKSMIDSIKLECLGITNNKNKNYYKIYEPENNKKIRSVLNIHEKDVFQKLINKNLVEIGNSLLGGQIYIHQSRINFKLNSSSNGWNWHSDFETWFSQDGMQQMRCFTCMIAVDDNTKSNGALVVIPKSHKTFISCPKNGGINSEDEFAEQTEGVPNKHYINKILKKHKTKPKLLEINSGDLVLFDCNLLHYSGQNKTNESRTNIYFVLNSVENKLNNPIRPLEMANNNPKTL